MPKGGFWSDTFEQLAELGHSTVKQTGQAVKQTVSPSKIIGQIIGTSQERTSEVKGGSTEGGGRTSEVNEGKNNTPLDFQKLQQSYQNQDKQKENALRSRLFQLVKSGEEKAVQEKEKKTEEEKRKEIYEEQEKKKRQQQQIQQQIASVPQGKVRRSILSKKKAVQQQQTEVKPSTGKQ